MGTVRAGVDLGCGGACAGAGAATRVRASSEPAQTQTASVRAGGQHEVSRSLQKVPCGFISVVNPDVTQQPQTYGQLTLTGSGTPTGSERELTQTGSGIRVAISGRGHKPRPEKALTTDHDRVSSDPLRQRQFQPDHDRVSSDPPRPRQFPPALITAAMRPAFAPAAR